MKSTIIPRAAMNPIPGSSQVSLSVGQTRQLRSSLTGAASETSKPSPSKKPIRLMIVDDHPVVRKGIKSCLAKMDHLEIVGEAADGREALLVQEGVAMPRRVDEELGGPGVLPGRGEGHGAALVGALHRLVLHTRRLVHQ
jgi:hypothetical protein